MVLSSIFQTGRLCLMCSLSAHNFPEVCRKASSSRHTETAGHTEVNTYTIARCPPVQINQCTQGIYRGSWKLGGGGGGGHAGVEMEARLDSNKGVATDTYLGGGLTP